ncbi:hypothetical protein Droror1_Dr00014393 [Drosera rotundifolia]
MLSNSIHLGEAQRTRNTSCKQRLRQARTQTNLLRRGPTPRTQTSLTSNNHEQQGNEQVTKPARTSQAATTPHLDSHAQDQFEFQQQPLQCLVRISTLRNCTLAH